MGSTGTRVSDEARQHVFTTGEAADICGVSQQTIIRCFDTGRLQGFRVPGSRFRRIPRDELIRFMKENEIPFNRLLGDRRRILVIDNDEAIMNAVLRMTAKDGRFDIKVTDTLFEAGVITSAFHPQIIVLGTPLCTKTLEDFMAVVAKHDETIAVLVLAPTNMDDTALQHLFAAGVSDVLRKPVDFNEFVKRLEDPLNLKPITVPA